MITGMKVKNATIRETEDTLDIECRFEDGQKFAAIQIDKTIDIAEELAQKIIEFITENKKEQA